MLQGKVIKTYNGFYYVQSLQGMIACKVRGKLKKDRYLLLAGDRVEYQLTAEQEGMIEAILPRRNQLLRPAVANVDQVVIVLAAAQPNISFRLLDKLLVMAETCHVDIYICFNKSDLADTTSIHSIVNKYREIGYTVFLTSTQTNQGIEELQKILETKTTVFAGPSGVGKSSLLNLLGKDLTLNTQTVSTKIGRGRHTTRFTQLLPLGNQGFLVDTPGFSTLDFSSMTVEQLPNCFPEFRDWEEQCRFRPCLHEHEPDCAVKQALASGNIFLERYQSYCEILEEIRKAKKG